MAINFNFLPHSTFFLYRFNMSLLTFFQRRQKVKAKGENSQRTRADKSDDMLYAPY